MEIRGHANVAGYYPSYPILLSKGRDVRDGRDRCGDVQNRIIKKSDILYLYNFYHSLLLDIEKELNVPPPPLHSIHPSRPLYEACKLLIQSHARRLPLIDHDSASGMEIIASVLTQYRVLKFVASNVGAHL